MDEKSSGVSLPTSLPTSLPSLTGLVAFEAAARRLSFQAAAKELHISPSAVSHRIRNLEAELGHALFERRARAVRLTSAGEALAPSVSGALALLRDGVAALDEASGPLVVSCSPSFAIKWLVPRLEGFRAEHPGVELHITADDRLVDPRREAVDVCVRFGPGGYPGLKAIRLAEERVFPVCSPALAEGLSVPDDLRGHTLLHDRMLAGHALRVTWRSWLEAAGARRVEADSGPYFSHASLAIQAAMAGQGVALARGTLVREDLAQRRLVKPFELELDSGIGYWLVAPRRAILRPELVQFRDWLLAEMARNQ